MRPTFRSCDPTATRYLATNFNYSAERNSYNASSCNGRSGTNVSSVTTNTGGSSLFNGCWLTIEIPLPTNYSAPHPSSDTVTNEGGWWKIRYNMSGCHQRLLHRPDDVGGHAARQPRAPRAGVATTDASVGVQTQAAVVRDRDLQFADGRTFGWCKASQACRFS